MDPGFWIGAGKRDTRNGRLTSQRNFPTVRADIMAQKSYGSQWAAKLEASAVMIDSSMIAGGEYLWAVDASHVEVTSFLDADSQLSVLHPKII